MSTYLCIISSDSIAVILLFFALTCIMHQPTKNLKCYFSVQSLNTSVFKALFMFLPFGIGNATQYTIQVETC